MLFQIVSSTQLWASQTATIICSFNNVQLRPGKLLCGGDLSNQDIKRFEQAHLKYMGVPATDHLQAEVVVCNVNIIRLIVGKHVQQYCDS